MKIESFVFNPFQVNCYIIYNDSGKCLIVDASCSDTREIEKVTSFIERKNLTPLMIINTHGHVDHLPGNLFLSKKYSIDIAMHRDDLYLIDKAVQQGLIFGFKISQPPHPTILLEPDSKINLGSSELEIRHAPGHSPGSVVLYSAEGNFVITGDVLFAGSIGRTDLPGGNYEALINSIHSQLMILPGNTVVYPGHGPATTIEKERRNNPLLIKET